MIGRLARAFLFSLLPAVAVGGALGTPVLIVLAGLLSLPSLLQHSAKKWPAPFPLLVAFLTFAAVSSLWSEHAALTQAWKLIVLAPLSLVFAVAAAEDQRLTRVGGIAAFSVLAVLLGIEALWDLPLNRAAQPEIETGELLRNVSRGASLLLVMTWGATGALIARGGVPWRVLGALALAISGFVALQFGQFANALAFAAGLIAFLIALVAPRATLAVTVGALLVWLLLAPILTPALVAQLTPENLPYSWNARVEIWTYICERIWERPWFGHGLDAARAHAPAVPVHPHSSSLQIWFDLGAVGVLLAAALMITAGRVLVRHFGDNRPAAAAAAGTLAALGVIANVSFNLWAEWWIASLFIAGALVGALRNNVRR